MVRSYQFRKPTDLDIDDLFRFRPELGYDACMLRTRLAVIVDLIERKGIPHNKIWKALGVYKRTVYAWLNEYNDLGVDTQSLGYRCRKFSHLNRQAPVILTEDPHGKQIEEYRRPGQAVDNTPAEETDDTP